MDSIKRRPELLLGLSAGELRILFNAFAWSDERGTVPLEAEDHDRRVGLHRTRASRALQRLHERGLIEYEPMRGWPRCFRLTTDARRFRRARR